jgi:hypothetical protein
MKIMFHPQMQFAFMKIFLVPHVRVLKAKVIQYCLFYDLFYFLMLSCFVTLLFV